MEMPESTIMANGETYTVAVGNPARLATEYTPEGAVHYVANRAGGVVTVTERLVEWGTAEKIKQCPRCEAFHSAYDPPLCFGCAVGLN